MLKLRLVFSGIHSDLIKKSFAQYTYPKSLSKPKNVLN